MSRLAEKVVSNKKAAAPKAPRSAWHVFIHEAGPSILAQRPDVATMADRIRAIGAAWKSLPDAGKQKYGCHSFSCACLAARLSTMAQVPACSLCHLCNSTILSAHSFHYHSDGACVMCRYHDHFNHIAGKQ